MTKEVESRLEKIFPSAIRVDEGAFDGTYYRDEKAFEELGSCIREDNFDWAMLAFAPRITYTDPSTGNQIDVSRHGWGPVREAV